MRYEKKYIIDSAQEHLFYDWKLKFLNLKEIYKKRKINSIYYDDLNFTNAKNNISGLSNRVKSRIRWYGINENTIFNHELKIKKNNLGFKDILKTNSLFFEENINDYFSYKFLKKFNLKNDNSYYGSYISSNFLFPQTKVSYDRQYFLYNNCINITFDTNLTYEDIINNSILNKTDDFVSIIEIKFEPKFYENAKPLLDNFFLTQKRFSKYIRSLSMLNKAQYI